MRFPRTSPLILLALVASTASAQATEEDLPPAPPPPEETIPPPPPAYESPSAAKPASAGSFYTPEPEVEPPPDTGAETHDGFHLRIGLGFGGVSDKITLHVGVVELDGRGGGAAGSFHLGIGGEIAEGLTLGGMILSETVTNPEIQIEGVNTSAAVSVGTLGMLGVFLDWYPDAREGFHFGGGLAGGSITTKDEMGNVSDGDDNPGGGGLVLLIGYDWWVGDEWSLGLLGRIVGASLSGPNIDHQLGALSILFSVAYH